MTNISTAARKLKITVVIDSDSFVKTGVPSANAPSRTAINVNVGGRTISADIATKSIRKAVKALLSDSGAQQGITADSSVASSGRGAAWSKRA